MSRKSEIYLVLRPYAGSFNSIRHYFSEDRIPVITPYPLVTVNDEPCFVIDNLRLSEPQKHALAVMLLDKYGGHPDMNVIEQAIAQVEAGLPISKKWRLRIEGDPEFATPEAQDFAYELNQLSNEPNIQLAISPFAAWHLIAQLQVAARHPANNGESARIIQSWARLLQSALPLSDLSYEFLERGWNPDFDRAVPFKEIE